MLDAQITLMKIYNKVYNMLLDEYGLDPDKYEREDEYMTIVHYVNNGVDAADAFRSVFDFAYGINIAPAKIRSRIALCSGPNA